MRDELKFYELRQKTGYHWSHIGFFKTLAEAEKHEKEFNTKVMIAPIQIVERSFHDYKLEQMKEDLASSERPQTNHDFESEWD